MYPFTGSSSAHVGGRNRAVSTPTEDGEVSPDCSGEARFPVWTWAAPFRDDREAAWAAITSPDVVVEFARSYLGPGPIRRAFGAILEPLVAGPDYREVRFDPLRVVVAKLHATITKILATPEMQERLAKAGAETRPGSPADFGNFIKSEKARWAKVIKDSGAKFE